MSTISTVVLNPLTLNAKLEKAQQNMTTISKPNTTTLKLYFVLKTRNEKNDKQLEDLIALGREMYNDWTFYRNGYYSML